MPLHHHHHQGYQTNKAQERVYRRAFELESRLQGRLDDKDSLTGVGVGLVVSAAAMDQRNTAMAMAMEGDPKTMEHLSR
jgi:hypothetical protein